MGETTDEGEGAEGPEGPARQKPGLPFAAPAPGGPALSPETPPPLPIEDPSGHALDAFYARLARVEAGEAGAVARITYYGDSVIASDWITATLRRKMQARFGDAGHGFILIADAWPGYHHDNIARFASKGWKVSRVVGPYAPDGLYGLGGVSFVADGPGMFATVATAERGEIGRKVSSFQVTYATEPGGGKLSLTLDNEPPRVISTSSEKTEVKALTLRAPDGPHKLEIRSNGGGPVRVFHVILERDGPGVVVDAVGIIGCRLRFLDKIDDAHWADELRRRDPALIAFTYGAVIEAAQACLAVAVAAAVIEAAQACLAELFALHDRSGRSTTAARGASAAGLRAGAWPRSIRDPDDERDPRAASAPD